MKKVYYFFILFISAFLCNSCKNTDTTNQNFSNSIENCINGYISKWNYKPALEVAVYGKKGDLNYRGE